MAATYRGGVTSLGQAGAKRRPFPALDPEPPPRSWWWRLLMPAAAVVLVAAVVVTVQFWPFSSAGPKPAAAARVPAALAGLAGGRIVVVTAPGGLALSDPDGRHVTQLRALGKVGQMVTASPDHRYLALGNGQLVTVRHGPVLALDRTNVPLNSDTYTAWPDPFADNERALVMLADFGDPAASSSNPISVIPFGSGQPVSLGAGDQVAGDPQALGVFSSVAAPELPSATSVQESPDSGIVLHDAGRPAVLLATAASLTGDLGYPRSLPVSLIPTPSPSGAEVAVTVRPAAGSSAAGVVVLNRAGRLLGAAPFRAQAIPTWSPSGRSLAYLAASGSRGPELKIWTIGQPITTSDFPASSVSYGGCVWSPEGTWLLCLTAGSGNWAIAKAAGGRMTTVRGPGVPITWLPPADGR
jgi:WD40 repeat protein